MIDTIQFDTCGPHKHELPKGVKLTRFSYGADNYCYEGWEFEVVIKNYLNEEFSVPIQSGDWIIYREDGSVQAKISNEHYKEYMEYSEKLRKERK